MAKRPENPQQEKTLKRKSNSGMFIDDIQIRETYGGKADDIIAALDANSSTQKNKATRDPEARFRPKVEEWLAANIKDESPAGP